MKCSDLKTVLAERLALSPAAASLSVESILQAIAERLAQQGRIEIRGFGSFACAYRPAKQARNPKTGAVVFTRERYLPRFKPSKSLQLSLPLRNP